MVAYKLFQNVCAITLYIFGRNARISCCINYRVCDANPNEFKDILILTDNKLSYTKLQQSVTAARTRGIQKGSMCDPALPYQIF